MKSRYTRSAQLTCPVLVCSKSHRRGGLPVSPVFTSYSSVLSFWTLVTAMLTHKRLAGPSLPQRKQRSSHFTSVQHRDSRGFLKPKDSMPGDSTTTSCFTTLRRLSRTTQGRERPTNRRIGQIQCDEQLPVNDCAASRPFFTGSGCSPTTRSELRCTQ